MGAEDEEELGIDPVASLSDPVDIVPPEPDAPEADPTEPPSIIDRVIAEPLEAPISGKMPEDDDAFPPPVPAEAPGMVPKAPELPYAQPEPGAAPDAGPPKAKTEPTQEDVIRREGAEKAKAAEAQEAQAAAVLAEQERHARQAEQDRIDALATRQEAEDALNARIAEYDKNKELRDPRSTWTTRDKVRNGIAIIFGGLGAAAMAAGGGSSENVALTRIEKRLQEETERQKFNISRQADAVVQARAGLRDADAARRKLAEDEDARHVSRLNEITAQGVQALKAQGVPAAQIETDQRIVQLRQAQAAAAAAAHKTALENKLLEARAAALQARAVRDQRKAKGGGAGGGAGNSAALGDLLNNVRPDEVQRKYKLSDKALDRLMTTAGKSRTATSRDAAAEARTAAAEAQQDERTVRDVEGNPIGLAPNARALTALTDKIAAVDSYRKKVDDLAAHIEKHGRILNPLSDEGKERASLAADVQAQGRQISGIQASDAGQKLEHEMIGGSGVGIERMASPEVLRDLSKRAGDLVTGKLKATLTPIGKAPPRPSPAAPAAPTEPPPYRAAERAALGAGEGPAKPDAGKVARARAIVADPKLSDAQKAGARGFLSSVGM